MHWSGQPFAGHRGAASGGLPQRTDRSTQVRPVSYNYTAVRSSGLHRYTGFWRSLDSTRSGPGSEHWRRSVPTIRYKVSQLGRLSLSSFRGR